MGFIINSSTRIGTSALAPTSLEYLVVAAAVVVELATPARVGQEVFCQAASQWHRAQHTP